MTITQDDREAQCWIHRGAEDDPTDQRLGMKAPPKRAGEFELVNGTADQNQLVLWDIPTIRQAWERPTMESWIFEETT